MFLPPCPCGHLLCTKVWPCQYICCLYLLCLLDIELLLLILGYVDSSGDKSKRSVVEIKGRFSVTSENVDLAKVSELGGYTIELNITLYLN